MTTDIQETLLQLFEQVRHDPETVPVMPIDGWQEGSLEWQLLASFRSMAEQVQQRMLQFKQMEQQLREKEEQYRSIFEATYDALFIMDLDGFLVEVNPAFCSMFGYRYEEIIGSHSSVFTAPVSLPSSMQERVKGLGGVLQIESAPGRGTCVCARVPFVV